MSDEIKCTLSNDELLKAVRNWNSNLCNSGGRDWMLTIPANVNSDPDILIEELCKRFECLNNGKPMLQPVADELKEPNHLDFKIQNKYGEWVWKSPYAMNRYADELEAWHNQERQKFKEKHGLSDEELNYRGEQVLGTEGRSHCL